MTRNALFCLGAVVFAGLAGCAECCKPVNRCAEVGLPLELAAHPTSTLLFDRVPDSVLRPGCPPITAEHFAWRSPWPSTRGWYTTGEAVYYREYYYDHQGHGNANYNDLHRRFQSYRIGAQFR